MVKKWDVTIPRLSGKYVRTAYIYLPECYEEDDLRRYLSFICSTDTMCFSMRMPLSENPGI